MENCSKLKSLQKKTVVLLTVHGTSSFIVHTMVFLLKPVLLFFPCPVFALT